jgi:hypothetical protein
VSASIDRLRRLTAPRLRKSNYTQRTSAAVTCQDGRRPRCVRADSRRAYDDRSCRCERVWLARPVGIRGEGSLMHQNIKGVPEQPITLLEKRMYLFLRQGHAAERNARFTDHALGMGNGFSQFGSGQTPDTPSSVDRSNGMMVRQSIPSTWQIS